MRRWQLGISLGVDYGQVILHRFNRDDDWQYYRLPNGYERFSYYGNDPQFETECSKIIGEARRKWDAIETVLASDEKRKWKLEVDHDHPWS